MINVNFRSMLMVFAVLVLISTGVQAQGDWDDELIYMWNEEKLARDVYAALADSWNLPVFSRISASENQHMSAVAVLLEGYGLEIPAETSPGAFADPEFEALYVELVDAGRESLVAALKVGVTIEEMDIADLQEQLEHIVEPDIVRVYQSLLGGSNNHLRSFTGLLETQGIDYRANPLNYQSEASL